MLLLLYCPKSNIFSTNSDEAIANLLTFWCGRRPFAVFIYHTTYKHKHTHTMTLQSFKTQVSYPGRISVISFCSLHAMLAWIRWFSWKQNGWGRALITCISCGTHALPIYIYIVNDCKRKTRQNYRIDYTPNYYYYYIFRSAIFTQYKTNCIVIKLNKVRWKEDIDVQIQMLSILHWLSIVLFNSW